MAGKVLYLKLDSKVKTAEKVIRIGDLGKLYCKDEHIANRVKPLKVHVFGAEDKGRCVIGVLQVTKLIEECCPSCTVDIVGGTETIVELVKGHRRTGFWVWFKVAFVSLLCFLGTVYTVMAYQNEVDINGLLTQSYRLALGKEPEGYTLMEAGYSLGLSFGIILFYNHVGKRRLSSDPSPVEVEMRTYADEINVAVVEMANREEKTIDVS